MRPLRNRCVGRASLRPLGVCRKVHDGLVCWHAGCAAWRPCVGRDPEGCISGHKMVLMLTSSLDNAPASSLYLFSIRGTCLLTRKGVPGCQTIDAAAFCEEGPQCYSKATFERKCIQVLHSCCVSVYVVATLSLA